jgi:hypothetical protein
MLSTKVRFFLGLISSRQSLTSTFAFYRDITPFTQALDEDTGNTIGLCSPALRTPATPFDTIGYTGEDIPDFALGPAAYSSPKIKKHPGTPLVVEKGTSEVIVDMGSPPSAFHYQVR